MRKLFLFLNLVCFSMLYCHAQIDIREYSTSYAGRDGNEELHPILLTAIPYAGNFTFEIDHKGTIDLEHVMKWNFDRQLNTFGKAGQMSNQPGAGHLSPAAFRIFLSITARNLSWFASAHSPRF